MYIDMSQGPLLSAHLEAYGQATAHDRTSYIKLPAYLSSPLWRPTPFTSDLPPLCV